MLMQAPAVIPARALLLNASREPLCLVTTRRAVALILRDKAVVVESDGHLLHSEHSAIPVPLVICLTRYVHVPFRAVRAPTRRTVLQRDRGQCAYCSGHADTVDHVIPRSRGGRHAWENVVAACARCNRKKADHLLSELGWSLRFQPTTPSSGLGLIAGVSRVEPAWEEYFVA